MVKTSTSRLMRRLSASLLAVCMVAGPIAIAATPASALPGFPVLPGAWNTVMVTPSLYNNDSINDFGVDGSGNIYVLDTTNGITKFNPASGAVTTLDPSSNFYYATSFTVDSAGDVYIVQGSYVYLVSSGGSQSVFSSYFNSNEMSVGPIALDSHGNVFVVSYSGGTSKVWEFINGSSTPVQFSPAVSAQLQSIAVGPNGDVYGVSYFFGSALYDISPVGATVIGSGFSAPEGVAVDSVGNVYVADENTHLVYQVSPTGVQSQLPSNALFPAPEELVVSAGTLSLFDENVGYLAPNVPLYPWTVASPPQPVAVNLHATLATVNGTPSPSVTATWTGTSSATGYLCTLMYGFGTLSTFTVHTTSPSCTFNGLALGASYGVQVISYIGTAASSPSTGFSTPASFTITCKKGKVTHKVTGTNPRCPVGYHTV